MKAYLLKKKFDRGMRDVYLFPGRFAVVVNCRGMEKDYFIIFDSNILEDWLVEVVKNKCKGEYPEIKNFPWEEINNLERYAMRDSPDTISLLRHIF